MRKTSSGTPGVIGTALAAGLAVGLAAATPSPASAATAPSDAARSEPARTVTLSVGRGEMFRLPRPMSDLFVADDKIADVQVRSNSQLYVFGKGPGETTVSATDKSGVVVWSAIVRVGQNIGSLDQMLALAMPDAKIVATPMNGVVLLTGTVATPDDVAEAARLVQAFVGENTQVLTRIKAATPLQVNLQVRIAEVTRDFLKNVGVNILTNDATGGFGFGIAQGRPNGASFTSPNFTNSGIGTTLGFFGKLAGLDIASSLDLAEQNGFVTTLANPNLTALSGETASFLAGGEIPIPISQGLGAVSVDYKQYGVSLSFTPFVLSDGRISMRVRPEVSQLTSAGSVSMGGFTIPGLTTRRTETTVELGSGQALVIGGLIQNTNNNSINKAPFLGDIPILGALFRSNNFRRNESELVIVVTPYLVKPIDSNRIALPTDGYRAPTDADRILLGLTSDGKTGERRPVPRVGATVQAPAATTGQAPVPARPSATPAAPSAAPGFSF